MRRTGYNHALAKATLAVATRSAAATVNGTTVDTQQDRQRFRVATVLVHAGTITDGTHTIEVQESADDSTWTAVPDDRLQGSEPAIGSTDDDAVYEIGVIPIERYLRVSVTTAGATSGGTFGAVVLLGQPNKAPVTR